MPEGFKVQTSLEDTLLLIQNDIKDISDIISGIYEEMETLDEKKWQGKEKEKINEQYMPYLKKLSTQTSTYLNSFVDDIRYGATLHQEADIKVKKTAEDIDEIL